MITRIALIRDGIVSNVIVADAENYSPPAGFSAMPEAEALALYPRASDPVPGRKTWDDPAAFLDEFSLAETAAISLSNDPVVAALRLVLAAWRGEIWSDDERIQMGLSACVSADILTAGRRSEILAP